MNANLEDSAHQVDLVRGNFAGYVRASEESSFHHIIVIPHVCMYNSEIDYTQKLYF